MKKIYYACYIYIALPLLGIGANAASAEGRLGLNKTSIAKKMVVSATAAKFSRGSGNGSTALYADVTVSGKVTSETGEGLVGVTVMVKGTAVATATDVEGNYTLKVPDGNAILLVSYIGYVTQEVAVSNRSVVNVSLKTDAKALDEVVVVGYGTQQKSDVTGAVQSADLEAFREAPNVNIAQSLQGTVPGLNVGQVNSAGSTPQIQLRGATTIGGNENVLIILDGIMYNGSLASINPDDIASIDVLKDASSTAIYGAQAANGVIIISSRKGKAGKTRISYTGSFTTQSPNVNLRPLNRQEFLDKVRDLNYDKAFLAPDYTTPNPDFDLSQYVDNTMLDENNKIVDHDFNWWEEATNPGHIQEHQFSVSGGTEKTNYLLSAGLTDQKGFIINDTYNRKSVRLNLETKATDWWTIGVQSFASFNDYSGDEPQLNALIRHSPLLVPYDENGELIPFPTNSVLPNPFLTYDVDDYDKRNTFFGNFYSEIAFPFVKGLTYRINYGNNYRVENRYQASRWGAGQTGSASRDEGAYYDYTLDNIVTYKKELKEGHDLDVTLLYGASERMYSRTLSSANGFSSLTLGYNSLEQGTNQFASSDAWSEALNYQMARVNYKLADKYLLTATLRRDGFSGFAQNEKWGLFPSAALGWIISNEPFFNQDWIDFLKVRASYGVNGNMVSRYSSLATFSRGRRYVFGEGGEPLFGQQAESLANPNLRWERTAGANFGLDFNFFNNRLSGSLEYYHNTTTDLLFPISLPKINGIDEVITNIGELQNKGVELSLTSINLDTRGFMWKSTVNFSRNRNEIKRLFGEDADGDGVEDNLVADNLFIGESLGTIYGYESDGIYQLGDEIPTGYYPGTFRVKDQNGDNVINASDRVILGREEPAYRVSLLNTFTYKGFTLKVFLNSVQGGSNSYRESAISPNIGSVLSDNAIRLNYFQGIDYWSPSNPNAEFPRSLRGAAISPGIYRDRSFVRLQDVSLSYKFSGGFITKLGLENLSMYVSGKNLATWTDWQGWDPETGQGFNDSGRPVMKGYSVGFNITL